MPTIPRKCQVTQTTGINETYQKHKILMANLQQIRNVRGMHLLEMTRQFPHICLVNEV